MSAVAETVGDSKIWREFRLVVANMLVTGIIKPNIFRQIHFRTIIDPQIQGSSYAY